MAQAPANRGATMAAASAQSSSDAAAPRRGRPKGTGINDNDILADIGRRLAADPDLKPTTAIKQAGVADPSVVRRLREKLKISGGPVAPEATVREPTTGAVATSRVATGKRDARPAATNPRKPATVTPPFTPQAAALAAALTEAATAAAAAAAKTVPAYASQASKRNAVRNSGTQTPLVAPAVTAETTDAGAAATRPDADMSGPDRSSATEDAAPNADIMKVVAETIASTTRLQMELFQEVLRLSPLSDMLRQQKAFSDAMAAALAAQRKVHSA
jgi:hypothetical protein